MSFTNVKSQLDRFRDRKQPFTVWKTGQVDQKTGLVTTCFRRIAFPLKTQVWWVKGQVVRPHKIRKPLRDGHQCSAGLYFYTTRELALRRLGDVHNLIEATVKPEDIIAVSCSGGTICCVAATVIKAPDPRLARMAWLEGKIQRAKENIRVREEEAQRWLEEQREDQKECLQQMVEEFKSLRTYTQTMTRVDTPLADFRGKRSILKGKSNA